LSVATDIATPLIAGVFALVGAGYASRRELRKVSVERFNERERDFERAQGGYRACYREFLTNVAAYHAQAPGASGKTVTLATLLDNFWEASFAGDPLVIKEMKAYWPAEARAGGEAPGEETPDGLLQAMLAHGSRSLDEQLNVKREQVPGN
jgi:hypothetical protein